MADTSFLASENHSVSRKKGSCILCPCPSLTAYWTPPPSCCRRVCCEGPSKMGWLFRDVKSTCIFLGVLLLSYYFVMDVILFMRYRTVNIVDDSKSGDTTELYSPFTHLSVKALMNDHTSQYIISPTAEYFDYFTNFAQIFTFITPNVISFIHLFLGFLSGKFVASENLHDRRIGVLIFQIRTWLDAFDGVVYRSQSNTHLQFQSVRATLGYYVDTTCDAVGGVFLMFGVMFYLFKRFNVSGMDLPSWNKSVEAGVKPSNGHNGHRETYTKKQIFWKVLWYGLALAGAGKFWDLTVGEFKDCLQVPMRDLPTSALQFELQHSTTTIFLFYMWRVFEGQAMLQYIIIPIFLDKVWEFLNYTQYIMFAVIVGLYVVSLLYIRHLRTLLQL